MNKMTFMSTHQELQGRTIRLLSVYSNFFQPCLVHAGHLRGGGAGEVTPTSGAMSLTLSKGRGSCPPKCRKQKRRRERRGPARHSSRLMTCSLRVMMDKDFSRWDEIKIYTRCFRTQLVGRSSSFNSISAAGDGHPESGLSNGAVSWQNLHADTHTYTRSQTHVGRKREKKKTRLWHIWSLPPQLRVSYRCWQEAKSQNENERNREREREGHIHVRTPPVLISSRKLLTKMFVNEGFLTF